jgi:tetratricopeptide (TPR) repeat protein
VAPHKHQELMTAAVQRDGAAQEALLLGDREAARDGFAQAAKLYRQSWEEAPPSAYGRLVGMLKSAALAGAGDAEARYAREALADADPESVTAAYAGALAALILGEDDDAEASAQVMLAGNEAFGRTADAIAGIAASDLGRYQAALTAIVRDFEARTEHLTGVAIADTALVLATLAARRGIVAAVESPVLPAL